MTETLDVTYTLTCQPDESPEFKARDIALEQTVELPPEQIAGREHEVLVGRVADLTALDDDRHRARIAYPVDAIGGELTQLLNLLFGNISLKEGIRIDSVDWPAPLLDALPGPHYGLSGLRSATRVPHRPLLCTALKPMGLDATALAARCEAFALGGVDIIKDDHGLANQPTARFDERLQDCQEAVTRANAATNGHSLYFPNVTGGRDLMEARARLAAEAGCEGVLVNPWTTGLDAMASLGKRYGLMVMAHPSLTGAYFRPEHGIAPEVLLGELFRMAGADAVIYPNVGGRFGFSQPTCEAINDRLRRPLGRLRPAFPTVGGGVQRDDIARWAAAYGRDTVFLIGGSLYAQGDVTGAARALIEELERAYE